MVIIRTPSPSLADFGFSVSHTTRPPRVGETNGIEYHFTTLEAMEAEVAAGKFIETAVIHGNRYGTSIAAVRAQQSTGRVCILDIDVQGILSMKKTSLEAVYIFIRPPSIQVLESRLRGRKTESEQAIQKRLKTVEFEMPFADDAKYPGMWDSIIVNDELIPSYQEFRATVMRFFPSLPTPTFEGAPAL